MQSQQDGRKSEGKVQKEEDERSIENSPVNSETTELREFEDEELILLDKCPYIICFLTEFFAMTFQIFVGCIGVVYKFNLGCIMEAFCFGLGRIACYETFNHISPVHMNPAKSLGFLILGRMHIKQFVFYIIAQYGGSITGLAYVKTVAPSNANNICVHNMDHRITYVEALVMEFITTMILMLVISGATDPINEDKRDSLAIRIGLTVFVLILSIEPFTGAGKNPARSFSAALLYNKWKNHWLYQVGPYAGAVLGAVLYRFVFNQHMRHSLHHVIRKRRSKFKGFLRKV